MTNTIIKLIGYNEISCFKYLNQAFLCSFFLFYKFYPINFHFAGYLYSNQKMKIWFYPVDKILMGLNTQMLSKLSVALRQGISGFSRTRVKNMHCGYSFEGQIKACDCHMTTTCGNLKWWRIWTDAIACALSCFRAFLNKFQIIILKVWFYLFSSF